MPPDLTKSIVRLRKTNGVIVGAGFMVADGQILTCAHVVATALGISSEQLATPTNQVIVEFPIIAPTKRLTAKVSHWQPVQAGGGGDVALLQLNEPQPEQAQPVHLISADRLWKHDCATFGFPGSHPNGTWASGRLLDSVGGGWIQVEDTKQTGYFVQPGFSGAPVWDEQLGGVVGLNVAADKNLDRRTAFIIPTKLLIEACPPLQGYINNTEQIQNIITKMSVADIIIFCYDYLPQVYENLPPNATQEELIALLMKYVEHQQQAARWLQESVKAQESIPQETMSKYVVKADKIGVVGDNTKIEGGLHF
jgi:hypothetical protein